MLVALIIITLPVLSFAGEKEDLAEESLELTGAQKLADQTKQQVLQMNLQRMSQIDVPEENKVAFTEFQLKIQETISNEFNWDKIKNMQIKLFTDIYTTDELKGLIQFYKTPLGQALIKKQPIVNQKIMMMLHSNMQNVMSKLEKIRIEFLEFIEE